MPSGLRPRLALIVLLGVFLIPIVVGSMRGLTHVLTCQEQVRTPFTIGLEEDEGPQLGSSLVLERGDEEEPGLCGGLTLDVQARPLDDDRVELTLPITNGTDSPWRGTVNLEVEEVTVPIGIDEIPPGETRTDTVTLRLDRGTHEVGGSLLIGP